MSPYRKHMPSFTLVLTSGYPSVRSAIVQLSPSMLPTVPDPLMKTIDLRQHSTFDELLEHDEDVDSQTIFAAEQLQTFDHVAEMEQTAEKTSINRVKRNLLFLLHKLGVYKRKFVTYKNGL